MRPTRREWIALSEQRLAVADHKARTINTEITQKAKRISHHIAVFEKARPRPGHRDGTPSTFHVCFSAFVVRGDKNGLLLL
jgi:hypothetical protein